MLTLLPDIIPIAMFPPSEDPLMISFGADAFRLYKDNNQKAVLCVGKAHDPADGSGRQSFAKMGY